MADQDRRRAVHFAQVIGGGDQVVDIRGKMRVGEFALAAAQPGEIETQHGDAVDRQPLGDALGGQDILAAGEAMREQREGGGLAQRQIERGGELLALGVGKLKRSVRMTSPSGRRARMHDVLEAVESLPGRLRRIAFRLRV